MINLKLRTEYNFGRAYGPVNKVVQRIKDLGQKAAAITDVGTWGHVAFYNECKAAGIKPILGTEIAVVENAMLRERQQPNYMTLLARNNEGLKEIYELVTLSTEKFYYFPRVDYDDIAGITDNVYIFSGTSPILDLLRFKPNLFLELSYLTSKASLEWAAENGVESVLMGDNYYPAAEDKTIYEILLNTERDNFTFPMHIADYNELSFHIEHDLGKHASQRTNEIADDCNITLPQAEIVRYKKEQTLEQICRKNKHRCAEWNDIYETRLMRELNLIKEKDYEDYFYVLWDAVAYAKTKMLVGPARGSSCGSLVCYLLGITEIDPIPYGLLFERFIDVTRKDLPDVDIDFADDRRELVFEYLHSKYGSECVARLGTISRFKAKSAISTVAKSTLVPEIEVAELKSRIIERSTGDSRARFCIMDTFNELDIGRAVLDKHPHMRYAGDLEYHASHSGQHAAGIVVTQHPVTDYCSLDKRTGALQVDKYDAEKLNLLKIDALGLRTLSILQDILDQIEKPREWLYNLPTSDQKAYDVLNNKRYAGIFQFEGFALQSFCSQMKVESFEDFASITSLARPGPLNSGSATDFVEKRSGKKPVDFLHPSVQEYTKDTYGTIIYQEQVMQIVRNVGQLSWEDTSNLRKAMSKSYGVEYFDQFWLRFKKGAEESGINEKDARYIWDHVNSMGSWSFNRCIVGSTKVYVANRGNNLKECTIEELYDKYVADPSPWIKQRKMMPWLVSLNDKGEGWPQMAKTIHKNGEKLCYRYYFEDKSYVDCTKDHKFLINGKWREVSFAKKGDKFSSLEYFENNFNNGRGKDHISGKRYKIANEGFMPGDLNPGWINGASVAHDKFKNKMKEKPCQDCDKKHRRMEAHHNDFCDGAKRPKDLAWLCPSCHKKRHYKNGRKKRWSKPQSIYYKIYSHKEKLGRRMTYDIEMPEIHNYRLQNGLVTHNSHAVAYGLVSYWCCYLKAYFPLQFALANLRNAKDDNQAIRMLREFSREGFKYLPVDSVKSEVKWSLQDGVLVGGLTAIKGCGIKKAEAIIKKRKNNEPFSPGELHMLNNPITPWDDVFECRTRWGHIKNNPEQYNIGTRILDIAEVSGQTEGEFLVFGKLKEKNLRDMNEAVNLMKRGGKKVTSNNLWLNIMVEDDTGSIICRIDRFHYEKWGKPIVECMSEDEDWLLIKGSVSKGFRLIVVDKYRHLTKKVIDEKSSKQKDDQSTLVA